MDLWAVVADAAGAWEAECVYSVWTTEADAQQEIARLKGSNVSAGCYGGRFHVVRVTTDTPSNTWIAPDS